MSIVAASTAAPTSYRSVSTENPDIEFERRWTAWEARGLAHERTVRRRFLTVVIADGARHPSDAVKEFVRSAFDINRGERRNQRAIKIYRYSVDLRLHIRLR